MNEILELSERYMKMSVMERMKYVTHLHKINLELAEHLNESLMWTVHYCQKNNLPLPNMEKIKQIIQTVSEIEDQRHDIEDFLLNFKFHQPIGNRHKNHRQGNSARIMVLSSLCRNLQV